MPFTRRPSWERLLKLGEPLATIHFQVGARGLVWDFSRHAAGASTPPMPFHRLRQLYRQNKIEVRPEVHARCHERDRYRRAMRVGVPDSTPVLTSGLPFDPDALPITEFETEIDVQPSMPVATVAPVTYKPVRRHR